MKVDVLPALTGVGETAWNSLDPGRFRPGGGRRPRDKGNRTERGSASSCACCKTMASALSAGGSFIGRIGAVYNDEQKRISPNL